MIVKRLFDILFSLCALILLLPLFVVIAIAIKLTSKGPIFFKGTRIGRKGKVISFWKFRSMYPDAKERLQSLLEKDALLHKEWKTYQKLKKDPRITPFGRFLRAHSLDELPQFWNVLLGSLSVVGPRALEVYQVDQAYKEVQNRFGSCSKAILSVRPGITCLWQVMGRNQLSKDEQVALEARYVQTRSLWLDLKIIAKTIPIVLSAKGAY